MGGFPCVFIMNNNIILETPVPHGDGSGHVITGVNADIALGDKKILTEVVNEESELAKKCGDGVDFQKWYPERVDCLNCDGIPVMRPSKRVDIPSDKGILG